MPEKQIPKSLKECLQIDPETRNLAGWRDYIDSVGKILLFVILGAGVIGLIATWVIFESFWFGLLALVPALILAFAWYLTYKFLTAVLGGLTAIVYNTRISADVAVLTSSGESVMTMQDGTVAAVVRQAASQTPGADEWKCPACGKINKNYVGTCSCGASKAKPAFSDEKAGPDEWKCPKCGKINKNYVGTCSCGRKRP